MIWRRCFIIGWLIQALALIAMPSLAAAATPVRVCVLPAQPEMTARDLFSRPDAFDCDTPQKSFGSGDFWLLSAPLPPLPPSNASKSGQQRVLDLAARENLTVRQLAQRLGGYAGVALVGTPTMIADSMQEWIEAEGSDGFNVMFSDVPAGLDDFVNLVVPELQRRGLFRTAYAGTTLREHLGLPRPGNRFFPA